MKYLKVFTDFRELMESLENEEKGRLFDAMLAYAEDGTAPVLEGNERFVWAMARRIIDREAEAYEEKVNSAQRARGNKRKAPAAPESTEEGLESTEESLISKDAPMVSSEEKEKEKDHEKEKEKEKENEKDPLQENVCVSKEKAAEGRPGTHTPGREEIEAYCRERQNGIDADYFFNYYQAAGWRMGQTPIRDWRALVRTWEKRDAERASGPGPIGDTVQKLVTQAKAARAARQRNTLLNCREEPAHSRLEDIAFDIDEL